MIDRPREPWHNILDWLDQDWDAAIAYVHAASAAGDAVRARMEADQATRLNRPKISYRQAIFAVEHSAIQDTYRLIDGSIVTAEAVCSALDHPILELA